MLFLLQWAEVNPTTSGAALHMDNMEVKDEWQDEDFPR